MLVGKINHTACLSTLANSLHHYGLVRGRISMTGIDSFHQCSNNPALTAIVTKLTQIYALPCAEVQATVGYGDVDTYAKE